MYRLIRPLTFLALLLSAPRPGDFGPGSRQDSKTTMHQVSLNGHTFSLPEGFEIELAAGPGLADRPITAAFDDEGRLYVSDSSGSNDKVDKQLAERPHRIVRLEDRDGDGQFETHTVFADKMMFPEGTMWFDGSLYVSAPPSIWKLTDRDGDGVADERVEWFPGKTLTGCANDLHGPYLGPDGWIYWCKGAFARQTYERADKSLRVIPDLPLNILGKEVPAGVAGADSAKPRPDSTQAVAGASQTPPPATPTWSTRASHIFRCRPDGSGLEVVMTGGMDNPVDVVFTPGGERIFTTTFFQHPGGGRRDGLIHAVYGGIYGKDHDPIHEPAHAWSGPGVLPVLTHLGAAAPCGLVRYESGAFGREYRDNIFACLFNMHKITRHVLEPDGATFRTRDEDFLVSSNLDFHPTDVIEDADGSLIVVDTGGWYKLCCPTSQLHKPDILGALYRIRRHDSPRIDDPRGSKIQWSALGVKELAGLLGDGRPAVRQRATHALGGRGAESIPDLSAIVQAGQARLRLKADDGSVGFGRAASVVATQGAVWSLTRIDDARARQGVRVALADPDESVRQAALHSISLWHDREAVPELRRFLGGGTDHNRRAAAEALGRIGDKATAPALLSAAGETRPPVKAPGVDGSGPGRDRFLDHSLIYALIEIADPAATAVGLSSTSIGTRRAALIALSEMPGSGLEPQSVSPLFDSTDPAMREAAFWVVSRHVEWSGALAGYLRDRITRQDLTEAERAELSQQLARFAKNPAIQQLLAETAGDPTGPAAGHGASSAASRRIALLAMRDSGLKELPGSWLSGLIGAVTSDDVEVVRAAVDVARSVPAPKDRTAELASALVKLGQGRGTPQAIRLAALAAVPGGLASVDPEPFDFLRANLSPDNAVAARSAAVEVLAKAKLNSAQLESLTDSFKTAGPLEVDRLLAAFEQSSDRSVALKLVASLKQSPALSALRPDAIQRSLAKCGPALQEQVQELCNAIHVDLAKQKEHLEELLATTKEGDIRRGQAVFMGTKAACSSCHQFGYLGGNVGPDLTRIGGIRNERDLLESIAFPNASFVRSYEPMLIASRDGKVISGILKKDAPDEVVLAINATETARIARDDIDEIRPGTVSVMPSGLEQQLTRQELADLVAFLKGAK